MKNVQARGKLLERELSFAEVFAVAGRTHLDLVAPVLAAVVIGVEKVQAHHVGEDGEAPPTYVERTFRRYLECSILSHGFARAYCDECQDDFLIAYSCKCRGVCPFCNTGRVAETAAHQVDRVFPPLPVRQWGWRCPNGYATSFSGGSEVNVRCTSVSRR